MHYKNGREAKNGDPVIGLGYNGEPIAGSIHGITPGSDQCNCTVAVAVMGGVNQLTCQTVGNYFHAGDALAALVTVVLANPPTLEIQPPQASTSQS